MRLGLFLPPFQEFAEPDRVVQLARSAESSGWDGLFLWDHILAEPGMAIADPWVTLAGVAMHTDRIRLGVLVSPLTRRRPWVLARQMASLDRLSNGRLIGGFGLGDDGWREFSAFGEVEPARLRGERLDEALELLKRFLAGKAVNWSGRHFHVESPPLLPTPIQRPLPLWAACRWPNRRPLERAAGVQGCFPIFALEREPPPPPEPRRLREVASELQRLGAAPDQDLVVRYALSALSRRQARQSVADLEIAGVTWVLEAFGPGQPPAVLVEEIVAAGPNL